MLGRWTRRLVWAPYESFCRFFPLVPFHAELTEPVDGVQAIRIENAAVRLLARISGGYDYSVCYLVDGELLIDTGFPWARRRLRTALLELGVDELRFVVNTHYHEDHTGNNDLLRELTDARIFAHEHAISEIRFPRTLPWYRRFLFGPVVASEVEPVPERLRTSRREFRILSMPGHCPGHVCLFQPEQGWLFSGDLYIAPDLDAQLADADGPSWIESLERAIELRPSMLFDAHGVVVKGETGVVALLEQKKTFLVELRNRVREAASSARSVEEITRAVFSERGFVNAVSRSEGWLSLITASDFSRHNLVRSFLVES